MTLKGHFPVAGFLSAISRTFVQYFTGFQLTARSRSPSATAGLLVKQRFSFRFFQKRFNFCRLTRSASTAMAQAVWGAAGFILPLDAMHASAILAVVVCLSAGVCVCHKPVLYENGYTCRICLLYTSPSPRDS